MTQWFQQFREEWIKQQNTPFFDFSFYDRVESTNELVKEWGKQGRPQGVGCLALSQTKGRGRLGRSFYSPAGSGLYFSLLLRPKVSPQTGLLVTTAAAVAMAKAMEQAGKSVAIKWVNDIMQNNRKVCGILAQAGVCSGEPRENYIVLGVGVNLCPPQEGFPADIATLAGGLFEELPHPATAVRLVVSFLQEFYGYYEQLEQKEFWEDYACRNWLLQREVTAGWVTGVVTGIDSDFSLLVTDQTGQVHKIGAGEVTLGTKNLV